MSLFQKTAYHLAYKYKGGSMIRLLLPYLLHWQPSIFYCCLLLFECRVKNGSQYKTASHQFSN